MDSTDSRQIGYEINSDPPAWWRGRVDDMPWRPTTLDGEVLWYVKEGPCPRCRDEDGIRVSVENEGYLGLGAEYETDIFVRCLCTGEHPRPEGVVEGCGWGGYVAGPQTEDRS
ncbi:hypothetical protein [Plantactinospora sp. KBS50]|uniref:hypothetical protein n=1 Tax=Plantactinospora sp. KBS50 TaxID=2024580 RepID=UPI000BAAE14C|nr:hypothetical protein [Plantactinospora sp. KBS50]ASW55784.1 hypothetical protein CIK06_18790 [Plantactinospora sp. KBS50]